MTLVGAAFGACVFAVIWRLVSPRPCALVQLARFDAHVEAHRDGRRVTPPGPPCRCPRP